MALSRHALLRTQDELYSPRLRIATLDHAIVYATGAGHLAGKCLLGQHHGRIKRKHLGWGGVRAALTRYCDTAFSYVPVAPAKSAAMLLLQV